MKCQGYINLYRSGWFHRLGKPHTCDMHAGDVYQTEDDARRAAEPRSHYVTTVPITWEQEMAPHWSTPAPLGATHGYGSWESE